MRRPIWWFLFGVGLVLGRPGRAAAEDAHWSPRAIEAEFWSGLGGPWGLIGYDRPHRSTPTFTWIVGERFGNLRYLPLQLELNAVIPHGLGANLILNIIHTGRFRLHLLDPGVFYALGEPVSARNFRREWDVTLGVGLTIRPWQRWALTADWRMYFPSPFRYVPRYGHFILPIYDEAFRGGQIWFGASFSW